MSAVELPLAADSRAPGFIRARVKAWLAAREWPPESADDLVLVVSELVSNAVEHAYAGAAMPQGSEPGVLVRLEECGGALGRRAEITVHDFGAWRVPPSNPGFRGHGLRMVMDLVESCDVAQRADGTTVRVVSKPVGDRSLAPPDGSVSTGARAFMRKVGNVFGSSSLSPVGEDIRMTLEARERLRWLEVVTDAGLTELSVEQLLDDLLEKVRELMDVDTSAVLLLDPTHEFLIATAAKGIEEEVHQGVRIPLGSGFAGRIAADRHWVAIEQVNHDNVLNPILREKGIASLLGVPLLNGPSLLGVLHVGTLQPRTFNDRDAAMLQMVADRLTLALQARLSQAERSAASVMQRYMLPARLPAVPGLEFASRYVCGGDGKVGGDWYDVFSLPGGTVCLVLGDAAGHGLPAARTMSQLREVLRANALHTDDPAELLSLVDTHTQHFRPGAMAATLLCAMLDPATDTLRVASAGHPPPILAPQSGQSVAVPIPPGLPIGVELGHPRHSVEVLLPPGAVLCLYSDGLVERRGVLVDDGIESLRDTVRADAPETVCVDIMRKLVGIVTPEDDVAVLVVRRSPET